VAQQAVILELKAVEQASAVHAAQLLTCIRLTRCRVGLLIHLNSVSLADGICRRAM